MQRNLKARILAVAVCLAALLTPVTAVKGAQIELETVIETTTGQSTETASQNTEDSFYWRYITPQQMGVADANAEEQGAAYYFAGLQSDDIYEQYMAINKLVEYFNDDEVREQAIEAITPFLTNSEPKLADAAAFSIDILSKTYSDSRILHLADGSLIFTLFNDYSDYGSYNQIWCITDGVLSEYMTFHEPSMYITDMVLSPDAKMIAVVTVSNKSTFVHILDTENWRISHELIDSARIQLASEQGITVWQRPDYENYSGLTGGLALDTDGVWYPLETKNIYWLDDTTLEMHAALAYDGGETVEYAMVRFDCTTNELTVVPLEESE